MNDIITVLKDFNEKIEQLTEVTEGISSQQKVIDESVKRMIEDEKEKAEELLKRIKF